MVAAPTQAADPSTRHGALVDRVVFTTQGNAGKGVGQIEAGRLDILAQGITKPVIERQIRRAKGVEAALSYGTSADLTLNTAGPELANGDLNPFGVRAIREALNWLIDRRHIADAIYGGLAQPRYLPLSTAFPDYARFAAKARSLELAYGYQPQRAEKIISREMEALGAKRENGVWHHDGEPIELKFLIRSEDTRKQVGDYIANRLAAVGFQVRRMYRTSDQASPLWQGSPPKAGKWHLYTGGWISPSISRDEAGNFAFYYTPKGLSLPLWQAYDPSDELANVAEELQRREYRTIAERGELMRRGLELAMHGSQRIWLVDQLNLWPRASDISLATDLAGGIAGSALWPYTIRRKDQLGGEIVIGTPKLLINPWNPIDGGNWIYDTMIQTATFDRAVLPDPYTGLYHPQSVASARVTVTDGSPVQKTLEWLTLDKQETIRVPEDAWLSWDAESGDFVTVGEQHPEGLTARTRTRIRFEDGYLDRTWHDGAAMSVADVVLPWVLRFARAAENSPLFDSSHVPGHKTYVKHFRGWRIVGRDPLVVEVYSDQIFPDAETIAAQRMPSLLPWHVIGLGVRAEAEGELAFSQDKADRKGVPWLSQIAGPSLSILDRHRAEARNSGYIPFDSTLGRFVSDEAVAPRYAALADWRDRQGHYWIGDGPFEIESVHPVAGTLTLARNESFDDPSDKWLRFSEARIPEPAVDGPMTVSLTDKATFEVAINAAGAPYPPEAVRSVKYLLFSGAGELTASGAVERTNGRWRIQLPRDRIGALGAGANRLEVIVRSKRVALPRFASHVFATVPADKEAPE
jgi:peptide/nickel transport system substrate-binding protein